MKILILDNWGRLCALAERSSRVDPRTEQRPSLDEFVEIALAQQGPFVLLWHWDAKPAIEFLRRLDTRWPENLYGCVFFSGEPNANADAGYGGDLNLLRTDIKNLPTHTQRLTHFLSWGIPYDFSPDGFPEQWKLLVTFRDEALSYKGARDNHGVPWTDFSSLEPRQKTRNQVAAELRSRLEYLTADTRRGKTEGRDPVKYKCPACPLRGPVHHELEDMKTLDVATVLDLLASPMVTSLKKLLELDATNVMNRELLAELCKTIDVRPPDRGGLISEKARLIRDRLRTVFNDCKILNLENANALELLHTMETQKNDPDNVKRLAVRLTAALKCDCQTNYMVDL